MPSIAVVGASNDRSRFANKAVRAYLRRGWTVHPVHPREQRVEGLAAVPSVRDLPGPVDRVTLYVPPEVGLSLLEDVAAARPGDLFLNPGSSSPEVVARARELGLEVVEGCAILDVGESPTTL